MPEEVLTVVKIPVTEIEEWMRTKHTLPKFLTNFSIEGNDLVLYFKRSPDSEEQTDSAKTDSSIPTRRRARRKRNRMKTRGWQVVARMTNSKGQECSIYKPFVDALRDRELPPEEQRRLVEKILKSNRNRPSETSIQYFLENTIEYLQNQDKLLKHQEDNAESASTSIHQV